MALIRFFFVFVLISFYFAFTLPLYPFLKWRSYATKRILNRFCSVLAILLTKILNVNFKEEGFVPMEGSSFIVANHMGYLDVIIMLASRKCSFVTSTDVRNTPFLGQISQLAGCLFVNRQSRKNIHREVQDIVNGLEEGMSICVFPEATSTNGEEIIKFKRSMFQAPIDAQAPVLPITINYTKCGNDSVTTKNRDSICWYGDMDFLPHLWDLCKAGGVECTLTFHPYIPSKGLSSGELRDIAYAVVKDSYRPIESAKETWVKEQFGLAAF